MSSLSESVRRMLSENSFEVDNPGLTCILCKKLMIDAYQSCCGCNYCQGCITNYLSGERKYCVGDKDECKEEYLVLDKNVIINPRINKLILKLQIRCPNQSCTFETDLSQMEKHLSECTVRSISCPFLNVGCSNEGRSKNEVVNHMRKEEWIHANMLSEFVENTKNEIIFLKEESKRNEIKMKDIIEEISILKQSLNNKEEIIENQRKNFEAVKDELRKERENMVLIADMKTQIQSQATLIDVLKDEAKRRKNEIEIMRKELRMVKDTQRKMMMEEVENIKKDIEKIDVRSEIENQKKIMNDLSKNQESIGTELRAVIKRVRESRICDEKEFMWRIDNFSKMEEGRWRRIILRRYSIKFYLRVRCDGDNFGFFCTIMKGEFDDYLDWPMKHKIKLSLMNQITMEVHKMKEYRYENSQYKLAFNKATNIWNEFYVGNPNFISLKNIKESPGLLWKDSLVVCFSIDNP